MNDTGKVGCYVVILLLMGVFYVCVHIAEFLIKYFTSWQILFGGFAIIALVFMAIALYAEHFKLPHLVVYLRPDFNGSRYHP